MFVQIRDDVLADRLDVQHVVEGRRTDHLGRREVEQRRDVLHRFSA